MHQMKLLFIYSSDFEQDQLKKLQKKILGEEKEIGNVFENFKKNKDKIEFIKSLQGFSSFFGKQWLTHIKINF
jgi:hypothetical protein